MTRIDLHNISKDEDKILEALMWMIENQGAIGRTRRFSDLRWLEFDDDKEAMYFILKWS